MPGSPTGLLEAAEELLAVAATTLGSLAPERRYVSVALPALDCCDQLNVHAGPVEVAIAASPTGPSDFGSLSQQDQPAVLIATLTITVAWEVTTPDDPQAVIPVATLAQEGALVTSGGWALLNGIRSALAAGVLFRTEDGAELGPLEPLLASGAMAGWTLAVRTIVQGYGLQWPT